MKCTYCQKADEDDLILQARYWNVILAKDQTYLGRCVVASIRHCGSLSELKKEEWEEFIELVKKLESALQNSFGATMFNWTCLMNDAYKKETPYPHTHWHFRPRYNQKVKINELFFEDLEFGHHYDRTKKREIDLETKRGIISEIKKILV